MSTRACPAGSKKRLDAGTEIETKNTSVANHARPGSPGRAFSCAGVCMLTISVATEFEAMRLTLNDFGRDQLPFAAARALTRLAQSGRDEVKRGLPVVFDRPTPFTSRGVTIRSATKRALEAAVVVLPAQAAYLRLQEEGGTRQPKKSALVKPAVIRLNQYGNIPHRALARAKGRKDVFVGTVKGVGGFWQRTKEGLKLLARFEAAKQVERRPFFFPRVEVVLRSDFDRLLGEAVAQAMRSARP